MLNALVLIPLYIVLPALILYLVVKLTVKHAIRELKDDGTIKG